MAAIYNYMAPTGTLCITHEKCVLAKETQQNAVTSLPPTPLPKTAFSTTRAKRQNKKLK